MTNQEKEIVRRWLEKQLDLAFRKGNQYRNLTDKESKQSFQYWESHYEITDSLMGSLSLEKVEEVVNA